MTHEIRLLAPVTAEMRFWQRVLRAVLQRPAGALRGPMSALRFLLVTPTAHAAWLSSAFQLYLFMVFHQTPLARLGHRLGFPITIVAVCAALAPLHAGPAPTTLGEALLTPGVALIGSVALAAYHAYVAVFFRSARPSASPTTPAAKPGARARGCSSPSSVHPRPTPQTGSDRKKGSSSSARVYVPGLVVVTPSPSAAKSSGRKTASRSSSARRVASRR